MSMNNVRAFIVGVNKYGVERWNEQDGFANNAAAVAHWLAVNGVTADRIHLFADEDRLSDDYRARLAGDGISPRDTRYDTINRFWRTELPPLACHGDRLFFFWSGHGMIDTNKYRLHFCSDYSPQLATSVFNMSEFLANLAGPAYRPFAVQLLFADTCGTFARVATAPTYHVPSDLAPVDQLAILAGREGEFAEMAADSGLFTDAIVSVLLQFKNTWPERELFLERFEEAANAISLKTFLYDVKGNDLDLTGRTFGRTGARADHALSAYAMLARHATGAIERRHYERTLAGLGPGDPSQALTLWDMIDDLCDRQDARDGGAPYGLVEFLARLSRDPELSTAGRADIEEWLKRNGTAMRVEAEQRIEIDRGKRLLLLEVRHVNGAPSELVGYLRFADLTPVPGVGEMGGRAGDWNELGDQVRACLDDPRTNAADGGLELHFLTDPPLFDLPFHTIKDSSGSPIGEEHVCVVHSLRRARQDNGAGDVKLWHDWERQLGNRLADIPFNRLAPIPPWPRDGLCYMDFAVPLVPQNAAGKASLKKLVQLGAPFICWLHSNARVAAAAGAFEEMRQAAGELEEMPNALYSRRINGCETAIETSLLWDPRWFRPFLTTQGALTWQDGGSSAATAPGTTN